MDSALFWLSLIVFLPALGALVLALPIWPKDRPDFIRGFTLIVTIAVFIPTLVLADPFGLFSANFGASGLHFDTAAGSMQHTFNIPWIPAFDIQYFMGTDGISFPLVALTALVSVLAMGASWSITKHVRAYCILFLLLETGMIGVFLALDFFLFYVFWEVMLLPMYFLIGVWGGPRKEYAAIKFFLYTLAGSVLMLIAILMLYFNSDLREIAARSNLRPGAPRDAIDWGSLHVSEEVTARLGWGRTLPRNGADAGLVFHRIAAEADRPLVIDFAAGEGAESSAEYDAETAKLTISLGAEQNSAAAVAAALAADPALAEVVTAAVAPGASGEGVVSPEDDLTIASFGEPVHTFNLLALAAIGQHTAQFDTPLLFGWSLQLWAFLLLFIGFAIKVPSVPVHTWLPDAHVEAPTPISMILAGVLLKMGGYGILRICYPICPSGGYELAWFVCGIGVISMIYGAFAALAQKDFKRMVAYSSVSHMGYVVLGLGVWSAVAGTQYATYSWNMGVQGAMFQMIGHGISSAGMFFMVGVVYDRVHHRNLNEFGGLFGKMPVYTALAIGIFFAGLGLPGLCGFIGEVFVVLSVWNYSQVLAVLSAAVVVLTAAYILWALQRVYLGAEYRGPHGEELKEINVRELCVAVPLFVLAIVFGVFPQTVLRYTDQTVTRQVRDLAAWTARRDGVTMPAAELAPAAEPEVTLLPTGEEEAVDEVSSLRESAVERVAVLSAGER